MVDATARRKKWTAIFNRLYPASLPLDMKASIKVYLIVQ
jgi:hypothetical protein